MRRSSGAPNAKLTSFASQSCQKMKNGRETNRCRYFNSPEFEFFSLARRRYSAALIRIGSLTMPDDILIDLGRKFERQFARAEKALLAIKTNLNPAAQDDEAEKIIAPLNTTMATVANTPATTVDGLIIKARVAARFDGDIDSTIAESIVHDLLEIRSNSTSKGLTPLPNAHLERVASPCCAAIDP